MNQPPTPSWEGLYQAVLDSAMDAVITIDASGTVVGWNRSAERIFAYSAEAAIGRELASLIVPPAARESHRRGLAHLMAGGSGGSILDRRGNALAVSEEAATIFALLTTEPGIDEVELDGLTYFVARTARRLPQGSPASPAITNIVCRRLDGRLEGMAKSTGFVYSRYADDLTFSAKSKEASPLVGKLLQRIRYAVAKEGFVPHEKKTRILRRGRRQEVTGVVVKWGGRSRPKR